MSKTQKDLLSALLFLALGIIVLVFVPITIKDSDLTGVGPRTFPYFIGVCFVLLSLALGVQTILKRRRSDPQGASEERTPDESAGAVQKAEARKDELRVTVAAVIMLLYALLFDRLGYFLSTGLMITALLALFKTRKWYYYLICYIIALAIWAGFTYLLSVQLP